MARTAFDAAAQGDAAGKAVVEQYIHYLAVGVANMINIFFPEVIVCPAGGQPGENLLAPLPRRGGTNGFWQCLRPKAHPHYHLHPRLPRRGDWSSAAGQKPRDDAFSGIKKRR